MKVHNIREFIGRRKELRRKQTPQEEKLWWYLRDRRLSGFKFRRQASIGGYILDFYCPQKRLIIEIDGEIHNKNENRKYDAFRDNFFEELNYKILRFQNRQVDEDVSEVIREIGKNLK